MSERSNSTHKNFHNSHSININPINERNSASFPYTDYMSKLLKGDNNITATPVSTIKNPNDNINSLNSNKNMVNIGMTNTNYGDDSLFLRSMNSNDNSLNTDWERLNYMIKEKMDEEMKLTRDIESYKNFVNCIKDILKINSQDPKYILKVVKAFHDEYILQHQLILDKDETIENLKKENISLIDILQKFNKKFEDYGNDTANDRGNANGHGSGNGNCRDSCGCNGNIGGNNNENKNKNKNENSRPINDNNSNISNNGNNGVCESVNNTSIIDERLSTNSTSSNNSLSNKAKKLINNINYQDIKYMFDKAEDVLKKSIIDKIIFEPKSKKFSFEYQLDNECNVNANQINIIDDNHVNHNNSNNTCIDTNSDNYLYFIKLMNIINLTYTITNDSLNLIKEFTKFTHDVIKYLSQYSIELKHIQPLSNAIDHDQLKILQRLNSKDLDKSKEIEYFSKCLDDFNMIKDIWNNTNNHYRLIKMMLFPTFKKFKEIIISQQKLLLHDLSKKAQLN